MRSGSRCFRDPGLSSQVAPMTDSRPAPQSGVSAGSHAYSAGSVPDFNRILSSSGLPNRTALPEVALPYEFEEILAHGDGGVKGIDMRRKL